MKPHTELQHHLEVTKWLKRVHPKIIFRTDYSAGLKLTAGQAKTHYRLQHSKGYPDLWIAKPAGVYHGLYIELKKDGEVIVLQNGQLTADKHVRQQAGVLEDLARQGYAAAFAVGHLQAKGIITEYLTGKATIYPLKYVDPLTSYKVVSQDTDEDSPF